MVQGWAHLVVHHRFSKSSNEEIRRRATSSKPRPRVLRATAPLTCCGSYIRCVCARAARAGCMYPVCLYTVLTQCGMWSLRGARGRVLSSARPYPSIWMGPSLSAGLRGPSRTAWATTCERRCAAPLAHMHTSYSPVLPTCHAHTPLYFRSPAPVLRVFDGIVPSLPGTCGLCSWGTRGVVVWVASSRTRERAEGPSVLCAAVPVPCPCAATRGCEL